MPIMPHFDICIRLLMGGRRGWRVMVVWRKQAVAAPWKSLGGQGGGDVFISRITEKYS